MPIFFPTKNISVTGYKLLKHLMSRPLNQLVKLTDALNNQPVELTLLHSEQPKLYRVLAILSAIGLSLKRVKLFSSPDFAFYFID